MMTQESKEGKKMWKKSKRRKHTFNYTHTHTHEREEKKNKIKYVLTAQVLSTRLSNSKEPLLWFYINFFILFRRLIFFSLSLLNISFLDFFFLKCRFFQLAGVVSV